MGASACLLLLGVYWQNETCHAAVNLGMLGIILDECLCAICSKFYSTHRVSKNEWLCRHYVTTSCLEGYMAWLCTFIAQVTGLLLLQAWHYPVLELQKIVHNGYAEMRQQIDTLCWIYICLAIMWIPYGLIFPKRYWWEERMGAKYPEEENVKEEIGRMDLFLHNRYMVRPQDEKVFFLQASCFTGCVLGAIGLCNIYQIVCVAITLENNSTYLLHSIAYVLILLACMGGMAFLMLGQFIGTVSITTQLIKELEFALGETKMFYLNHDINILMLYMQRIVKSGGVVMALILPLKWIIIDESITLLVVHICVFSAIVKIWGDRFILLQDAFHKLRGMQTDNVQPDYINAQVTKE